MKQFDKGENRLLRERNELMDLVVALRARAEAAEARVAQLERELAKRRWIPVEERLPDPFICVMATNGRVVTEAKYYYYCGKLAKHGWYQIDGMAIGSVWATHWMPLPEPPEADNG
jgi:hypothetical protein